MKKFFSDLLAGMTMVALLLSFIAAMAQAVHLTLLCTLVTIVLLGASWLLAD